MAHRPGAARQAVLTGHGSAGAGVGHRAIFARDQAGRPVRLAGYHLPLPLHDPLPAVVQEYESGPVPERVTVKSLPESECPTAV